MIECAKVSSVQKGVRHSSQGLGFPTTYGRAAAAVQGITTLFAFLAQRTCLGVN